MSYGCFVDIRQQDGSQVRMHYKGMDTDTRKACEWIGIMEQMSDKFKQSNDESSKL